MVMAKKKTSKKVVKFPPKLTKLYKEAWDLWGKDSQLDMIIEECSELIKEVCKLKRADSVNFHAIIEEMADVGIMMEQFISVYEQMDLYRHYVEKKLKRLRKKLDDEVNN